MANQPDTEIIRKTVNEIQARQTRAQTPVPHTFDNCPQHERIGKMEDRVAIVEKRLADGDLGFLDLRKDVNALTEKVGTLTKVIAAVGIAIGLGLLGTAGAALLWVVQRMGAQP